MEGFADLLTVAAVAGFTGAAGYGLHTLRASNDYREATIFIIATASANAAFRMFTLFHRLTDKPYPMPWTLNIALLLQLSFAISLFLFLAVTYNGPKQQPLTVVLTLDEPDGR